MPNAADALSRSFRFLSGWQIFDNDLNRRMIIAATALLFSSTLSSSESSSEERSKRTRMAFLPAGLPKSVQIFPAATIESIVSATVFANASFCREKGARGAVCDGSTCIGDASSTDAAVASEKSFSFCCWCFCAFARSTNSSTVRTSAARLSDDSVGLLNPSRLDGDSMLEFDGNRFPMTLLFVAVGVNGIFGDEPSDGDAKPISSISSIGCVLVCSFVRSIVTTSFGGVGGSALLTFGAGVYTPTLFMLLFLRLPPHLAYSQSEFIGQLAQFGSRFAQNTFPSVIM
mmetsp:Transcript_1857/g.5919  ORF Transcript_1857/g.5919 Transcript_1857/m.5919 type:complete len:287 (-) Transcript_1857:2672-3532(-)